jgi:hypothetical protein
MAELSAEQITEIRDALDLPLEEGETWYVCAALGRRDLSFPRYDGGKFGGCWLSVQESTGFACCH